ncbi:hypothetical protein ABZ738_18895 [Micromonospora sp. NPDC047793]|uniref:hypothetical protein n=1 Tax=Micromonospora sp. NPDC047793 TaxID=3154342 RepID=UPI0033E32EFA
MNRVVGLLLGGLLTGFLGAAVLASTTGGYGVGAFGLRSETFSRIECKEHRVEKGGRVWHCFGQSPAQAAANDEAKRRATVAWVAAHPEERGQPPRPQQRTRISFAAHDGQNAPDRITATHVAAFGDRWIAHSAGIRAAAVVLLLTGAALTACAFRRTT